MNVLKKLLNKKNENEIPLKIRIPASEIQSVNISDSPYVTYRNSEGEIITVNPIAKFVHIQEAYLELEKDHYPRLYLPIHNILYVNQK